MEQIPLVCFPHAGAGMLYYNRWKAAFSEHVDLRIVQYPLREHRAKVPMPPTAQELARDVLAEFADALRGPYAIWGHSMGSVIGYEVAKLAQQRLGNPPLAFFSSGAAAPCRARFTRVADLDTAEGFHNVLLHYGGVRRENIGDIDFMRYFAPIIDADLRLLGSYEDPAPVPLRCPVVLMHGREDSVTVDAWDHYSDRPPEVRHFSGGHFFLDEHRAEMAALMQTRIQLAWQVRSLPDARVDAPDRSVRR